MRTRKWMRGLLHFSGSALVVGLIAIWIGSYRIAVERHWSTGFIRIDGGHIICVKHGNAPWLSGVWRTSAPDGAWYRVDPIYDELLWHAGIAWQIGNTSWDRTVVPMWSPIAGLVALALLLWLRRGTSVAGHCRTCGYNLTGNVTGVCSECGAAASGTTPR